MNSFKWHREFVTSESYIRNMGISEENEDGTSFDIPVKDSANGENIKTITIPQKFLDALHGSKELTAYTVASDIRKFEIELSWKRATFFWAFIVAIYTAYYHVLTKIYAYGDEPNIQYHHGKFPLLVLAALGLFFCFSWLLSSIGSKHWQENWENHLDLLEDSVTGPLYKTYKTHSYSVSKIVIMSGWTVTICSYGLLIYEIANLIRAKMGAGTLQFTLSLIFAFTIPLMLFGYSRLIMGNIADEGEIEFEMKKYEGFDI